MTSQSLYWTTDAVAVLTAESRARLASEYAYAAPAEHDRFLIVSIISEGFSGSTCLISFPFSFAMEGAQAGDLEDQIGMECRSRLKALRNSEPISSIADIRHPL